jgi:hypothetical protein
MEHVERNYKLIYDRMIEQMDLSLGYGKMYVESELNAGFLNFIAKPIVKAFYQYWSDKEARVSTLEQISITLNTARKLLLNGGVTEEKFDREIESSLQIYLKNDQTTSQCKKHHKNYNKLIAISKDIFVSSVKEAIVMLSVKEDVRTYDDLSRFAFKTKENAYRALKIQLDYNEAGIALVEEDESILKVAAGRDIITRVLRKGFEHTKEALIQELDEIFN